MTLDQQVRLVDDQLLKYVSRAGHKLEGALQNIGLDVTGFAVLDVGQSTGGFTDCLLQKGAEKVVGFDVGRDQLASSLRNHSRVVAIEGLNVKDLPRSSEFKQATENVKFDLVVADVSFISLHHVIPAVISWLKPEGQLLSLVKPQFELGAKALNKKGVVKDHGLYAALQVRIWSLCEELGLSPLSYFESPLPGHDGNREYFIHAQKKSSQPS